MRLYKYLLYRHFHLLSALVLSLGLLFAVAGAVLAHAAVIEANPPMNSTIALNQLPRTITVKTAENMKPGVANSDLFVYGPSGKLISQGDATIPLNDPMHMSVAIKPDKTGVYVVRWKTVSADDGDPDEGAFGFTVTATSSSHAVAATTGTPTWAPILAGIIALLVGLGVGIGIGRAKK